MLPVKGPRLGFMLLMLVVAESLTDVVLPFLVAALMLVIVMVLL
jgi:hypothetical protein